MPTAKRRRNAMRLADRSSQRTLAGAAVGIISALLLFWSFATFPPAGQSWEIDGARAAVRNHVQSRSPFHYYDWRWRPGNLADGSDAAPFSFLLESSMRLFGISLEGLRV